VNRREFIGGTIAAGVAGPLVMRCTCADIPSDFTIIIHNGIRPSEYLGSRTAIPEREVYYDKKWFDGWRIVPGSVEEV